MIFNFRPQKKRVPKLRSKYEAKKKKNAPEISQLSPLSLLWDPGVRCFGYPPPIFRLFLLQLFDDPLLPNLRTTNSPKNHMEYIAYLRGQEFPSRVTQPFFWDAETNSSQKYIDSSNNSPSNQVSCQFTKTLG